MVTSRAIRILVLKEGAGSGWVAQCLEYDIAAQGPSIRAAIENFRDVFQGQIALDLKKNREPMAGKKQAPPWYWQALEDAEPLRNPITLNLSKRSWLSFLGFGLTTAKAWVH